jgi:hypothetical protein
VIPDAGVADAGLAPVDAGVAPVDAGVAVEDAGVVAIVDAGSIEPEVDAGHVDPGTGKFRTAGCGCTQLSPELGWLGLTAVLVLGRLRRRR